ncbi:MAG: hypothetical protein HZB38_02490 [Planctomycetes bacterium]|nr:hypothetical protein [Planctomycetota bacterium]
MPALLDRWLPAERSACEVMQFALADMNRVDLLQPERPEPPQRPQPRPPSRFERDGRPYLLANRGPIRRNYGG